MCYSSIVNPLTSYRYFFVENIEHYDWNVIIELLYVGQSIKKT